MSDLARVHAKLNTGNQLEFFDTTSYERVFALAPLFVDDDFVGAGWQTVPAAGSSTNGYMWVKKIAGAAPPTVAISANAGNGIMQCALTNTSEKQDAALYWDDSLSLDITKGLVFEARVKLSVLPSASGVQTVFGVQSAWIDGPDNASYYVAFGATANGTIRMRSQDQTTQNAIATTLTVLNTDTRIYRIDMTDVTDIKYFVDGVQYNTKSQLAFAATGANAIVQPYVSVYKPSGTGVATTQVDYIRCWQFRS